MAKVVKSALIGVSRFSLAASKKAEKTSQQFKTNLKSVVALTSRNDSFARTHSTLSGHLCESLCTSPLCACQRLSVNPLKKYSTEVDKDLSSFLEKEIQFEVSRGGQDLPKVPGFEIKTDGANVTMTKTLSSETVTVKLSLIGAVDAVGPDMETQQEGDPPKMECRPPFEVTISKGSGQVLALRCTFPAVEDIQDAGVEADTQDQFAIEEVAMHDGEMKETTFAASGDTLDVELHDLLMDLLDERGVSDQFICQLVDYCTALEGQLYVQMLRSLKAFTDK